MAHTGAVSSTREGNRSVTGRRALAVGLVVGSLAGATAAGCGGAEPERLELIAVTFNTGTSEGLEDDPDDGYTPQHATYSDQYYGDGLAWKPAIAASTTFLAEVAPDVIGFQEIFYTEECADIPADAQVDFVCEDWSPGDPTVAQQVLGAGYQVMCHPGHPDKCVGVKKTFGSFRGCASDFCLEGAEGYTIDGCGKGARVGRAVIDLADGGVLTLVNVHASSGLTADDEACRVAQVDQVFVDLGDGRPGADGARNLVLGDLNTDPGRFATYDPSAARWNDFVGDGLPFRFLTAVGEDATPTYQGVANIDHVMSDSAIGSCWHAGVDGRPRVIEASYFDHQPAVCTVELEQP